MNIEIRQKQVLVLGCGPAGLLSAHAAYQAGHRVTIISKKQPSFIAGAQFLHTAIPDLTPEKPDGYITFIKLGDEDVYAQKVYSDPTVKTSWGAYDEGERGVWHLQKHYKALWDEWEDRIFDGSFSQDMCRVALSEFDAVFSTIPLKALFPQGKFYTEQVQILQEEACEPGEIIYSGSWDQKWYRASHIFGHAFTEYPASPSIENATVISKPLRAEVTLPWKGMHFFGRYGKWQKGVLVDDAYREARDVSNALHGM